MPAMKRHFFPTLSLCKRKKKKKPLELFRGCQTDKVEFDRQLCPCMPAGGKRKEKTKMVVCNPLRHCCLLPLHPSTLSISSAAFAHPPCLQPLPSPCNLSQDSPSGLSDSTNPKQVLQGLPWALHSGNSPFLSTPPVLLLPSAPPLCK
uniref:INM04 n=1 Tax=Homo sapiens TaxID=9606 RepID=Q86YL3_HUMAN|nr:INM04 [Homo sapiens]